jgi:hypothetical protein
MTIQSRLSLFFRYGALVLVGYLCAAGREGASAASVAQENSAQSYAAIHGTVPNSYGRLVAAIPDQIGTGLIFEDNEGVIRFVSMTGMKEGELQRYDKTPTQGGIPKAYGHLVSAVVNPKGVGLVFEDSQGTIRFLTITGKVEGELERD